MASPSTHITIDGHLLRHIVLLPEWIATTAEITMAEDLAQNVQYHTTIAAHVSMHFVRITLPETSGR
jgi:hypothetical protein